MPESISKAVLITGCSTGIGRATAEYLASHGWNVYATARKVESIADLAKRGCKTLALDVCDEASMRAAVETVERAEGAVGVLINNAGYGLEGAFEEVPMTDIRRQFETNVFGLIAMTKLVLPAMRRQRWGRIVNLSSMGGKLTFPGGSLLSRDQARSRSAQRRAAVRGERLRHRRNRDPARPNQNPLRRHRRRQLSRRPRIPPTRHSTSVLEKQIREALRRRPDGPLRCPARGCRRGDRKSHHGNESKDPLQGDSRRSRPDGPQTRPSRPRLRRLPKDTISPARAIENM